MSKYTFLLPAYKAKFLGNTLLCIQNQTYKDFKVLISNDCSPEAVRDVCNPFLSDSRFSYRQNERNIGGEHLVEHWNLLVDLCDTEYFILASDDDVYAPTFLEEIDRLITLYPEACLFRARVQRIDNTNEVIEEESLYEEHESQLQFLYGYLCSNHIRCISNYVFRTETLKRIGKFVDFPYACFSDTATVFLMSENGVCHTNKNLFQFRWSGENLSSVTNPIVSKGKCQATLMYFQWMKDFMGGIEYERSKLNNNIFRSIEHHWKSHALWHAKTSFRALSFKEFWNAYHFLKTEKMLPRKLMQMEFFLDYLNQKKKHE